MHIFISWSGETSRQIAAYLSDWLLWVLHIVKPWTSADIAPGIRWNEVISSQLALSKFGILCLTCDNKNSNWIHFEAGAIAKVLEESKVVPLLYGLEPSDIPLPIRQFQAVRLNKEGIWQLVSSINESLGDGKLPERAVKESFDGLWPKFDSFIKALPAPIKRTDDIDDDDVVSLSKKILEKVVCIERNVVAPGATKIDSKAIERHYDGVRSNLERELRALESLEGFYNERGQSTPSEVEGRRRAARSELLETEKLLAMLRSK